MILEDVVTRIREMNAAIAAAGVSGLPEPMPCCELLAFRRACLTNILSDLIAAGVPGAAETPLEGVASDCDPTPPKE